MKIRQLCHLFKEDSPSTSRLRYLPKLFGSRDHLVMLIAVVQRSNLASQKAEKMNPKRLGKLHSFTVIFSVGLLNPQLVQSMIFFRVCGFVLDLLFHICGQVHLYDCMFRLLRQVISHISARTCSTAAAPTQPRLGLRSPFPGNPFN